MAEDSKEWEPPSYFTIMLPLWNCVFSLKCILLWVKQMSRIYSFQFWAAWVCRWHKEKLQALAWWNTGWYWDSPWAVQCRRDIPACFSELDPATSATKKIIKIKEVEVQSVYFRTYSSIPSNFGVVRRWRHSCYVTSESQEHFCYLQNTLQRDRSE